MVQYSVQEYADMYFVYGECHGDAASAVRRYAERFPARHLPHRETFTAVAQRVRETGSVLPRARENGRPREVQVNVEENILERIAEDPSTSTREIAREVGVSHFVVWRTLKENLLYPYHVQRVQSLSVNDYLPRVNFCRWLLQQVAQNRRFHTTILMTDECCFTRGGILNFHNTHAWADQNPHMIREQNFQHRFSINVWAGIVGDNLIGPYVLPARLNGETYLNFLRANLPELLEDVDLQTRRNMWLMHDGAPAHFTRNVTTYLNETFPNKWIGRSGPISWPARSPELNMCDFFLWARMKELVYRTPVENEAELQRRVFAAAETIRNDPGIFERVRASLLRRAEACIRANGAHFEHLL